MREWVVGEVQDLRFWSLCFVFGEAGVPGGNVGMLLVPLGALFEVFVVHGCRSCCKIFFIAWRRACGVDCACFGALLTSRVRLEDEKAVL